MSDLGDQTFKVAAETFRARGIGLLIASIVAAGIGYALLFDGIELGAFALLLAAGTGVASIYHLAVSAIARGVRISRFP